MKSVSEFLGGIRLGLSRWTVFSAVAILVAVASAVLVLVVSDVVTQSSALRAGREMRKLEATVFTPYYGSQNPTRFDAKMIDAFKSEIDKQQAYSAVLANVSPEEFGFPVEASVVLLFGSGISRTMPNLSLCTPAPCLSKGHEVVESRRYRIHAGSVGVKHQETLGASSAYFDASFGVIPLDRRYVLNLPSSYIGQLNDVEREEVIARAVYLKPTKSTVDRFVGDSARHSLYLVPRNLAVDQLARLSGFMAMSAMYVGGLLAFILIVLFAYSSMAKKVIADARATFVIRKIFGALPRHTLARLTGFTFTVFIFLPVPVLALLVRMPAPTSTAAVTVLVSLLGVDAWFVFTYQRQFNRDESF